MMQYKCLHLDYESGLSEQVFFDAPDTAGVKSRLRYVNKLLLFSSHCAMKQNIHFAIVDKRGTETSYRKGNKSPKNLGLLRKYLQNIVPYSY